MCINGWEEVAVGLVVLVKGVGGSLVVLFYGVGWGGRRRGVCVKGPGLTRVGI